MAWLYLFVAGLLEVGWAIGLKYTDGFTRLVPTTLDGVQHGRESRHARPCAEGAAARHRLTRSGPASARSARLFLGIALFGESANALRLAVHRADRRRHCRIEGWSRRSDRAGCRRRGVYRFISSWPGLSRPSTPCFN